MAERIQTSPSRSRAGSEVSPLLVASTAALLAGWTELAFTVLYPRLTGTLTFNDWNAVWITPVSYLLFLLPLGALGSALRRVAARAVAVAFLNAILVVPAVFGVVWLAHPRLHRLAIVMLAVGVSLLIVQTVTRHPARVARPMRLVARALTAATVIGAIAALAGPPVFEWRANREARPAAPGRPNVLLLILDTVRARSLSLYGYSQPTTPALERIARRGVVLDRAFSTTSWTLPSHASMFTGRYPYELSADWRKPLGTTPAVVAEAFRDAGYRTGGFTANLNYTSRETGLARGFDHYEDWPVSLGRIAEGSSLGHFVLNNPRVRRIIGYYEPLSRKRGAQVATHFLRWLDRSPDTARPYFAFLNLLDAHEPYLVPEPFRSKFGPRPGRERMLSFNRRGFGDRAVDIQNDPAEIDSERRAYEGAVAYLDAVIDRLVDSLDRRGLLQSTILVITSDHGEQFGEYGLLNHGNSLYPPTLRVPLVIVHPATVPHDRVISDPVSLRDLPATLLDLARIRFPAIPGASLARYWSDSAVPATKTTILAEVWPAPNQTKPYPAVHGYMRGVVEWPVMLIRRGDGREELIALEHQNDSLVTTGGGGTLCTKLREQIQSFPPTSFPGRGPSPPFAAPDTATRHPAGARC